MNTVGRLLGIIFAVCSCSGCVRSTPSRYYTLVPAVPEQASITSASESVYVLGSVTLPAYLSTLQMVQRVGESEVSLEDNERWAEDLKSGLERTLTADLSILLGKRTVFLYQAPTGMSAQYRIDLVVDRFEVGPRGEAVLDARWWITDSELKPLAPAKAANINEPAEGASWESRAAALSRAVASLARAMAESLSHRG